MLTKWNNLPGKCQTFFHSVPKNGSVPGTSSIVSGVRHTCRCHKKFSQHHRNYRWKRFTCSFPLRVWWEEHLEWPNICWEIICLLALARGPSSVQDLIGWSMSIVQPSSAWTMHLIQLVAQHCHYPCQLMLGGQLVLMAHGLIWYSNPTFLSVYAPLSLNPADVSNQ